MLTHLRIENFALIDHLALDFAGGLNVLTGETGAGKSIILDALDVVLGGRVSGAQVRTGAQRAVIEATFAPSAAIEAWLAAQQIDSLEEGLVVVREISGKTNRARINGVLVNQAVLRELREQLLEITAQGQSLQLEKPEVQLELLDNYGEIAPRRERFRQVYETLQRRKGEWARKKASRDDRLQQLDLFRFQFEELSRAGLEDPQEEEQLLAERSRLAHAVELQHNSLKLYELLYEGAEGQPAVTDLLGQSADLLIQMGAYDASLVPLGEMLENALVQVQECARAVNRYGETVESDPETLEYTEKRLRQLKNLRQKYGPTLADVIAHYRHLERDLAAIEGSGEDLEAEERELAGETRRAIELAAELTRGRTEAAGRLEGDLVRELAPLGMGKVRFAVRIEPSRLAISGADRVSFLWSPNPGEPLQPLTETASGGEMARFLLALKACLGGADRIGTLVFDEIDIGVSGRVAQAVAEKLLQLGASHQVLCVTHQPLVAALADSHYRVHKAVLAEDGQERTVVRVETLNKTEARREELAQLVGGHSAHEALEFAGALLADADRRRSAGRP
ncbi:DNA repair protein RecN [Gloeobacter morelensis]|uniref:DNA repair protein RecN n=1 Tax=Gloeobacter morelensis MG652769 TaxID=2781736 RepID=A0ABY3PRS6_9CYAN|nr:DNA repair protein RecN [Gloeobacter morelensis]UFP96431.1 DNA repair protein RecN [Gloeobacter morelensis MG652769]